MIKTRCHTKNCRKDAKGRTYCSTCRSKAARKRDPVKAAWHNLKSNAKRRGVLFTIELEDFRKWCHKVEYIGHAGRTAESWTIDRRHNDIGYHLDNIQVLTNRDNVKKYARYDYRTKRLYYSEPVETAEPIEDLPF